ncbi:alpha/beta hydrolase [Streptomyces sp. JJ36]|uniref:alpha/beta hydrolase n=1 Tax=Streptomyces sp. JJ36 TaxID=2736645 RepID=UPI001F4762FB|nr:alpha/beta hydrolase [Streptomyces sp. JJ36]MCF6522593.1 alpha/beta fold hydrolase [Streptomyces sp. JJ36]
MHGSSPLRRPLRTVPAALLAGVLLLAGCSSGDGSGEDGQGDPSASPSSTRPPGGDAERLKPLPAAIPAELKPYYEQKLTWRECGVIGFECTTLRVPLDYDEPSPETELKLAVSRKKAEGDGEPIGSLMVNPGGPGGSAIEYLQQAAAIGYPAELRERYDIVGMDPRGVARSEPVECLSDREMDSYTRTDQTPDDPREVDKLVAAYKSFAKGCAQRSSGLLEHVSTVEAARDMDVLRAALGDDKLHYYGASYGTYLGATYAGLYPQRTGRLVLDGAMDPSLTALELNRQQTGGFATAFTAFAEDCVERKDCPLGTESPEDAGKKLSAFFREVDAEPLKTGERRTLTESLATTGVIQAMYTEVYWPRLRQALTDAMKDGDGAGLLALADAYFERGADGSYGNIMFANPAVNCLDLPSAFSGPQDVRKAVPSFEKVSPVFGRGFAWAALNCTYWQEQATGEPHRIVAEDAAPVVVVGTTRDPATPYPWAQALAGQMATARLLTYESDGHTAFMQGSECIDDTITGYFVDGDVPEEGKRCS